jgi:hypothetical protein
MVPRDPDRKPGDVAARGVSRLSDAAWVFKLADVAGPDEMFYDLRFVRHTLLFSR